MQNFGSPFIHDVHVRDGIMLTAQWNDGMAAYDPGGGGRGGSPANPVFLGRVRTVGGSVDATRVSVRSMYAVIFRTARAWRRKHSDAVIWREPIVCCVRH